VRYITQPKNRKKARNYAKIYYATPDQKLKRRLRPYDLTPAQFIEMTIAQKGRCDACGDLAELVIDHNHQTQEVRALLCHGCNTGIGHFKEDPSRLEAAAAYLRRRSLVLQSSAAAAPAANPHTVS
jgi:hypothetical protein